MTTQEGCKKGTKCSKSIIKCRFLKETGDYNHHNPTLIYSFCTGVQSRHMGETLHSPSITNANDSNQR